MEGISMDGVVEIGHSIVLDANEVGSDFARKALDVAMNVLFGPIGDTMLWEIKPHTWVVWNMVQRQLQGRNPKAIDIVTETGINTQHDDVDVVLEMIDLIGGYVAIMTSEEASIIMSEFNAVQSPITTLYTIKRDRADGGMKVIQ